jgi:phage terminase large subunit-like protein
MRPTLADFEAFCAELTLDNGRPMHPEPFQREMLADHFEGIREELCILPKKQGKTCLLAALGLFYLIGKPDAAIFVAAASREQATYLYDMACGFVSRSAGLRDQVVVRRGYRELWTPDGAGKLKVLAADVDTADGVLADLVFVDELHRHRSSELYAILRDSLGPRQGQLVCISTAGDDLESPLGRLRSQALALPGVKREGAHTQVRTADFALHEWSLAEDEDADDLELVKLANPASWQTIEELRRRKESPSTRPWEWRRFAAGQWVFGEESALSDAEWRDCARPGLRIAPGRPGVIVGIDLGWRYDTSAFAPVYRDGEAVIVHPPTIIEPPGDGTSTREEDIWAPVAIYAARWPGCTFALDPNAGGHQLAQRIERELPGCQVGEFAQRREPLARAAGRLAEAIASGRLHHPDDERLNRHALAATAASVGEGFRFVKPRKSAPPIDALIALTMAYSVLLGEEEREPEPVHETVVWGEGGARILRP